MNPTNEQIIEWLPATPEGYLWVITTNSIGNKLHLKKKVRIFFGLIEIKENVGSTYLAPDIAGWKFTVTTGAKILLYQEKYKKNINLKVEKH